jgi:hypothetical protein
VPGHGQFHYLQSCVRATGETAIDQRHDGVAATLGNFAVGENFNRRHLVMRSANREPAERAGRNLLLRIKAAQELGSKAAPESCGPRGNAACLPGDPCLSSRNRQRFGTIQQILVAPTVLLDRPKCARCDAPVEGGTILLGDLGSDPAPGRLGQSAFSLRFGNGA